MLTLDEFYNNDNRPHNMDYRQYVLDCLANVEEQLGTKQLLDALVLCLSIEELGDNLEYICRNYEVEVEEYKEE